MFISQQYHQDTWNKYFLWAFEEQSFFFIPEVYKFDLCSMWECL